ncbi:MAG TPA: efflux RND transporter periplasmic adaptor subunit [Mariniphaga sp.]|nr:efflux RND transporter periplasmic adaptor subunit [Mariniphaga sp.]
MKTQIFLVSGILLFSLSCKQNHEGHKDNVADHHGLYEHDEEHEHPVIHLTSYNDKYEYFIESTPLVKGEESELRIHVTRLSDFKPLESGSLSVTLKYEGDNESPIESETNILHGIGIIHFHPEKAGAAGLLLVIKEDTEITEELIPGVIVHAEHDEVHHLSEADYAESNNTSYFTKEQSWKIDFATVLPAIQPFGQVIKAAARVSPAIGNEVVVVARAAGIISYSSTDLLEGKEVSTGERLFAISGSNMADNNLAVRYAEAKNNFEKAQANYERMKALAEEQIVSQRNLLEAANEYENARSVFNNLRNNFNETGQSVVSPMNGYIKQLYIANGMYAEAGQPVVTVAGNNRLLLTADVAQRYASMLKDIRSANIRNYISGETYTLEELNGKILSHGLAANHKSFLIPVHLEIENNGSFYSGSMVEIYLHTLGNDKALVVPNSSLLEEQGEFFIWVQVHPELFEKRVVKTGTTDGFLTEITEGLKADERIVSRGAVMVKLARVSGTIDAHDGHFH